MLTKQDVNTVNQCKAVWVFFPDVQSLLCNHKRIPLGNSAANSTGVPNLCNVCRAATIQGELEAQLAEGLTFQHRNRKCLIFMDLTMQEKLSLRPHKALGNPSCLPTLAGLPQFV